MAWQDLVALLYSPSEARSFGAALANSPTFAKSMFFPAELAGAAIGLGTLALWPLTRRRAALRGNSILRDEQGLLASEFLLAMVPFLLFTATILEVGIMMRDTIVLHYAAYSAARSARVYRCPASLAEEMLASGAMAQLAMLTRDPAFCSLDAQVVGDKALAAARLALVSASPAWDVGACQRQTGCPTVPQNLLDAIAQEAGAPGLTEALLLQADYAFEEGNVRVDVSADPATTFLSLMRPGSAAAVTAKVTFRNHLVTLVGRLIGERRSDGYYYRETIAQVTLL